MNNQATLLNGLSCALYTLPMLQPHHSPNNKETIQPLPQQPQVDNANTYAAMPCNSHLPSYPLVYHPKRRGLCLDLSNCVQHSHFVAMLVYIQGINPITGLSSRNGSLQQYNYGCPVHKIPFSPGRLCEPCGCKWPKQNYLASNATPNGSLRIDGFRVSAATARQFVLTKQTTTGLNPPDVTTPATIAIAFYLSKQPKPSPPDNMNGAVAITTTTPPSPQTTPHQIVFMPSKQQQQLNQRGCLAITGGALVNQQLYEDPENIDFWQERPVGIARITHVPSKEILDQK